MKLGGEMQNKHDKHTLSSFFGGCPGLKCISGSVVPYIVREWLCERLGPRAALGKILTI